MTLKEFNSFRLVGGTSLSLQLGHRNSIDIDLYTDAEYGSIDFAELESISIQTFPYVSTSSVGPVGMGKAFFISKSVNELVKLYLSIQTLLFFLVLLNKILGLQVLKK